MKVYVDNNVLIDYEEKKIILHRREDIQYLYSYVHIEELIELGNRLEDYKDKRLNTIESLTECSCLLNNKNNVIESISISPQMMFAICSQPFHAIIKEEAIV